MRAPRPGIDDLDRLAARVYLELPAPVFRALALTSSEVCNGHREVRPWRGSSSSPTGLHSPIATAQGRPADLRSRCAPCCGDITASGSDGAVRSPPRPT